MARGAQRIFGLWRVALRNVALVVSLFLGSVAGATAAAPVRDASLRFFVHTLVLGGPALRLLRLLLLLLLRRRRRRRRRRRLRLRLPELRRKLLHDGQLLLRRQRGLLLRGGVRGGLLLHRLRARTRRLPRALRWRRCLSGTLPVRSSRGSCATSRSCRR